MDKREFLKLSLLGLGAMALPGHANALEFYPTTMDKKWAVLFGTWCGSARDAGVWISEGMDGIAQVYDVRENPNLSPYENIVVGGAIKGGRVAEEIQTYLQKQSSSLRSKIRGLYVVCGNMMRPPTQQQYDNLNRAECLAFGKEVLETI